MVTPALGTGDQELPSVFTREVLWHGKGLRTLPS